MKQIAMTLARCLFGLFYAAIGGYYAYQFFTNPEATWPAFNLAEKKLVTAMMEAKFFLVRLSALPVCLVESPRFSTGRRHLGFCY